MPAEEFDYIVVGAGSAGCVLAEGLSRASRVLLLEAGPPDRDPRIRIPAAFSRLFGTRIDWGFHTEPEPGADGRRLFVPRGRVLGGSSAMNAMIYVRGRPSDYDGWAAAGADGWGWRDVLPVFLAMEDNQRGPSPLHGAGGPVRVEDLRSPNPLTLRFLEAAIETGLAPNPDFNGRAQEGVGLFQVTQRRGRRWSAADSHLRPALRRPNLTVLTGTQVGRVLLVDGRAVGVDYRREGVAPTRAMAGAEVMLSAGAIGSPHLLQLSGIGKPDWLRSAGIEPLVDNPGVGVGLQDHPVIGVVHASRVGGTLDDAETPLEMLRWVLTRRGRLTSNVAEAGGFVRSSSHVGQPDLELHFGPVYFADHGRTRYPGHAFSLGAALLDPEARGEVRTRSSDPEAPPSIRGAHLLHRADVDRLVSAIATTRNILAAPAFDQVRSAELMPGPEVVDRPGLEAFLRARVELLYHPVGTAAIGPAGAGAVDPLLRVHGVEGLRVADASVMPRIVSGNTNAASLMIGARAVTFVA